MRPQKRKGEGIAEKGEGNVKKGIEDSGGFHECGRAGNPA